MADKNKRTKLSSWKTFQSSPKLSNIVWTIERIEADDVCLVYSREADVTVNEEQMKKQFRRKAR